MGEKFTITTAGLDGASVVCGDDRGQITETVHAPACLSQVNIQVQVIQPMRASTARVIARGNAISSLTWRVCRTHRTLALSLAFERDHVRQLRDFFAVGQFTLTRLVQQVSMRSVGALVSARCTERTGLRTDWEYTWQGTPFEP